MTDVVETAEAKAAPRQPANLIERIQARTAAVRQAGRGQPYNYEPLWYGRPDGEIVRLAGDPQNRAYYEDKGYAVLRPGEVEEWERDWRPQRLAALREKASIITTIRRIGSKHPGVEIVDNLDDLDTPDLREFLEELGKVTGAPVKVLSKKYGVEAESRFDRVDDAVPVSSGAELEDKLARSRQRR